MIRSIEIKLYGSVIAQCIGNSRRATESCGRGKDKPMERERIFLKVHVL